MLKKALFIALGALLAQGALAETLSPEAALLRAGEQQGSKRMISPSAQPRLAFTAKTAKGAPAVYVFNQENGGSLLVSASSLARPILGYTDSGTLDPANIPPQMQYWLDEYAAQIEYAEENDLTPKSNYVSVVYPSDWTYIAPLMKTKWDQTQPYNQDIKVTYLTQVATGCVATAMAQIMKYHEYPKVGHGEIAYTSYYGSGSTSYKTDLSMDFGAQEFDWSNMLNEYTAGNYTEAQAQAVAYLMKACGFSTRMQYGGASGTQVENAGVALIKYFDYDDSIEALQRFEYTHTEWATILYDQLKNVGPVLYSGHSLGNLAHAFVCDGYDGQGYFHINWGWSGLADGFYSIDAMVPVAQGSGGSSYGGFNFMQGMIVNIKKSEKPGQYTPTGMLTLLGNVTGKNVSSILTLTMSEANPGNLCNNSMQAVTPTIGICMENLETGTKAYNQASAVYFDGKQYNVPEMGAGSFIDPQLSVMARFDSQLPDGKYKVQLVWKDTKGDNKWYNFEIANGCHDYVYVTKKDFEYSVESFPMERFTIEKMEVVTPLYMRNPCQIRFTLTNPYDTELTQSIIPVLHYDDNGTKVLSFEGDSQLMTVGPKQTITATALYTFSAVSGGFSPTTSTPRTYILGAYDYSLLLDRYYQTGDFRESYYGDYGNVTMKRPNTNSTIQMRSIAIDNAHESGMVDGLGFMYGLTNFKDVGVSVTIFGKTGFVATQLTAVVYEYDPETRTYGSVLYEKNFPNLIFVEEGDEAVQTTTLNLSDADVSKIYALVIYYSQQSQRLKLGEVRFGAAAGVGEVLDGNGLDLYYDGAFINVDSEAGLAAVKIFDLSGNTVAAPVCNGADSLSIDAAGLVKGIYIVKATDALGNTKVLKVRN